MLLTLLIHLGNVLVVVTETTLDWWEGEMSETHICLLALHCFLSSERFHKTQLIAHTWYE